MRSHFRNPTGIRNSACRPAFSYLLSSQKQSPSGLSVDSPSASAMRLDLYSKFLRVSLFRALTVTQLFAAENRSQSYRGKKNQSDRLNNKISEKCSHTIPSFPLRIRPELSFSIRRTAKADKIRSGPLSRIHHITAVFTFQYLLLNLQSFRPRPRRLSPVCRSAHSPDVRHALSPR